MGDERRRVLLFTNSVQIGGMEEHVRLIAQDLDRERFEVEAVFPSWEPTDEFVERMREVADRVDQFTPDRRAGTRALVTETVRFWRHLRSRHIDVAHFHSTTYSGQWFALVAARAAGIRTIFVTEHLAPEDPPPRSMRWLRWLFARSVTGLVAVSERNRQARERHLDAPADKMHVVNNGIDLSRFADPADPSEIERLRKELGLPDGPVVGTAIRLEPGKGVADLVDGFAQLRADHDAHLLVIGDGSLRGDLEDQVARLGIADHVTFTGFISDPRNHIRIIDVFVLPVPFGSASIGLLEAMAMKRVCVITFGGEGEAVEPGISGYWAEPNDPSSIAHFVGLLLDDPARLAEMQEASRRRIETSFSSRRVADQLAELYWRSSAD